jgi:hypothetical protein
MMASATIVGQSVAAAINGILADGQGMAVPMTVVRS